MLFYMQFSLSIESLLLFSNKSPVIKCCMILYLILIVSKFLVACVLHPLFLLIDQNCNLEQESLFSWDTSQVPKAMFFVILPLEKFLSLEMLSFMNIYYPIFHLPHLPHQIGNIIHHLSCLLLIPLSHFPLLLPLTFYLLLLLVSPQIVYLLLHLMLIKFSVITLYQILFHMPTYLSHNMFFLCLLFLKLNLNLMLRLSNMTARNKLCNFNLMLLIKLAPGQYLIFLHKLSL